MKRDTKVKIVVPAYLETYSARGMITVPLESKESKKRLPTLRSFGISSLKAGSITSMNLQLEGSTGSFAISTTGPSWGG